MNAAVTPPMRDQRTIDMERLRLLSVFHFIGAGLAMLGLLFLLLHYTMMHAIFGNPALWKDAKGGPPPRELLAVFDWVYLFGAVWFVGFGTMNVISAFCLRARRHRTFSLVIGGLNCVHIPLGTILGVFTIITLSQESVRSLYEDEPPAFR